MPLREGREIVWWEVLLNGSDDRVRVVSGCDDKGGVVTITEDRVGARVGAMERLLAD